ncbi:MAG: ABC transporter ATP-binding protein, partial [Anaerotignum sp.]
MSEKQKDKQPSSNFKKPKHTKPKHTKQTLIRLIKYLGEHWLYLGFAMICIIFVTFATIYATRFIGVAIDEYIAISDFKGLAKICTTLLIIYVSTSLCTWLQNYLFLFIGQEIVTTIRKEIFEKIQKLPLKYFDNTTHGEIMSRVTNDVDNISTALNGSISQIFQSVLTLVGTFAMMLYLSIPLTLITAISIPIMIIATKIVASHSKKYYKQKQERLGKLNGHIEEIISGQKVVKVFCQEDAMVTSFSKRSSDVLEVGIHAEIFSGVIGPIMMALNNMTYAIVVVAGSLMMIGGMPITLGIISNFIIYSKQFTRPLNELANQINSMMAAFAGAERVFEILDESEELEDTPNSVALKGVEGDVLLKDVHFSYQEGHPILKDINLHAKPGQTIAFVG